MHICLIHSERVPPVGYGGTERVVDWLGRELARRGHRVTLLAAPGSAAPHAAVRVLDRNRPLAPQVPPDADVAHLHFLPGDPPAVPWLSTVHGNLPPGLVVDRNTVFVSRDHAARHGATCFVYNGLDPDDYGPVDWECERPHVHFLGKAAWRRKNVRGAIAVARDAKLRLVVVGGRRFNVNMGFRFTLDPRVRFAGTVDGAEKNRLLNGSRALIFPVRWHEPFGLAIIESLYFGCPVLGTPYGALPELVPAETGVLAARRATLAEAARHLERFDRRRCHEWVTERFTSRAMTDGYLALYEKVMAGDVLNAKAPTAVSAFDNALPWQA